MVPSLSLFALGWLVYLVGFIMLLVNERKENINNYDRIPHFLVVIVVPFLVLAVLTHAALSGPLSAFFGLLASLLSVVCFTGYGHILYDTAIPIYKNLHDDGATGVDAEIIIMFIGSLIASMSWVLVMVAWNFFTYNWRVIESNDYVVDEEGNFTDLPPPAMGFINIFFSGFARKLAALVLVFLAASWCVFVTGLNEEIRRNFTSHAIQSDEVDLQFSVWMVSVVGFLVILAAAGHAGAHGGASLAMGICSSLLGMLFLTSVGYTTHRVGMAIFHKCQGGENCNILYTSIPKYLIYQLSGTIGMCVAWACLLALWPFYFKVTERVQEARRRKRWQREYRRQTQFDDDSLDERMPLLHQKMDAKRPSISVL